MTEPNSFPGLEQVLDWYAGLIVDNPHALATAEQARTELQKARELLAAATKVKDAFISERGPNFDWNKYFVTLNAAIAACLPPPLEAPSKLGTSRGKQGTGK